MGSVWVSSQWPPASQCRPVLRLLLLGRTMRVQWTVATANVTCGLRTASTTPTSAPPSFCVCQSEVGDAFWLLALVLLFSDSLLFHVSRSSTFRVSVGSAPVHALCAMLNRFGFLLLLALVLVSLTGIAPHALCRFLVFSHVALFRHVSCLLCPSSPSCLSLLVFESSSLCFPVCSSGFFPLSCSTFFLSHVLFSSRFFWSWISAQFSDSPTSFLHSFELPSLSSGKQSSPRVTSSDKYVEKHDKKTSSRTKRKREMDLTRDQDPLPVITEEVGFVSLLAASCVCQWRRCPILRNIFRRSNAPTSTPAVLRSGDSGILACRVSLLCLLHPWRSWPLR